MTRWLLPLGALIVLAALPARADKEADDPFLWLEEVTGKKALDWVKSRNADSTKELTGTEAFKDLEGRLLKALESKDRIPNVSKSGPYYYNFWQDAKNRRGLWRRTTLD